MLLSGDYLLGTVSEGAGSLYGSLYKFYPDSNKIADLVNMEATDGSYPKGSLTKVGNKLYGLTYQGGNSHAGNIFEWDLTTQQYKERFQLDGLTTGIWPKGSLTYYNGRFYGINTYGKLIAGNTDFNQRDPADYFAWDPVSNQYQSLLSANYARCTQVLFNNKLYNPTEVSSIPYFGAINAYNPADNSLTEVATMNPNVGNFNNYQDQLSTNGVTYYNGKFYGMTPSKDYSVPLRGTIYEWDTATTVVVNRYDFTDSIGTYPTGNLLLVGNEFYGLTTNVANYATGYPCLFKWNPTTNVLQKKSLISQYAFGSPTYSGGKIYFTSESSYLNIYEYDPILDTTIIVYNEPIPLFQPGGNWNYTNCVAPPTYLQLLEVIPNVAPMLVNSPSAQNICVNTTDSTTFTITDTDADTMHFQITSSNTGLLPVSNIAVTNVGTIYTITYFGNTNQTGSAIISLTANDGYGDSVRFSFPVNITSTGNCSVLPVTWLSFTGILQNGKTILNWSVAQEKNNAAFVIERSTDGIHWTALFAVVSRGNTSSPSNYNGLDREPIKGINFYRIKQVDIDGRFTYSSTVSVKVSNSKTFFVVYPNPAGDVVNYELLHGGNRVTMNLELSGADGKLLKRFHVNNIRGSFPVQDLPAGIYVLTIKDNTGRVEKKKVIVQ